MSHTVSVLYGSRLLYSKTLNRFYIGETSNIEERLIFHKNSSPHKFMGKARDWTLFHSMSCINKTQAIKNRTVY